VNKDDDDDDDYEYVTSCGCQSGHTETNQHASCICMDN